ncbi:MAG: 50S ribosomal protein L35ae [Candidatus Nezhaarchaeota archaeon]|nr:50S ribosomal protein L35ae [Candidatus Nezhaarchaeota archaeon]
MLTGVVLGIRRGLNRQYQREALVKVEGYSSKSDASRLIGSRVELVWRSGAVFKGKVVATHGDNGVVVARFRKSLPGGVNGVKVKLFRKTS